MYRRILKWLFLIALLVVPTGIIRHSSLHFFPLAGMPVSAAPNIEYDEFIFLPLIAKDWRGAWISGRVIDASVNQNPLEGIELCTQEHECAVTNSNGEYLINLSSLRLKQVTAQKDGYITLTQSIQPIGNQTVVLDFILSPPLEQVNVVTRIVLTWDPRETFLITFPDQHTEEVENDLDAYLYLRHQTGNLVVYYDDMGNCSDFPSACLLYDERRGGGPETIDVTVLETGDPSTAYYFGVHHANYIYSGRTMPSLSGLQAQVCLYSVGENQATCYLAPEGDLQFWYLFSMDQEGNVTIHNCLTDVPPDVDNDPSEPDDPDDPILPSCP
jgi:hypothetical protein